MQMTSSINSKNETWGTNNKFSWSAYFLAIFMGLFIPSALFGFSLILNEAYSLLTSGNLTDFFSIVVIIPIIAVFLATILSIPLALILYPLLVLVTNRLPQYVAKSTLKLGLTGAGIGLAIGAICLLLAQLLSSTTSIQDKIAIVPLFILGGAITALVYFRTLKKQILA